MRACRLIVLLLAVFAGDVTEALAPGPADARLADDLEEVDEADDEAALVQRRLLLSRPRVAEARPPCLEAVRLAHPGRAGPSPALHRAPSAWRPTLRRLADAWSPGPASAADDH